MARQPFHLTGTVRNRATGAALSGLRVEAWDRDTRYHDMLGVDITDGEGRFAVRFDEEYYGDFAPDRLPDVYFRVLREEQVLASTENAIIRNLSERERDVVIDIDLPAEAPAAPDRVSAAQVYASISWFKQSDFRGVFNDGLDRVKTFGRLGAELTRGAVARASLAPLRSPSIKERDVVGQDPVTASANLTSQNVVVQDVRVYTPGERVEVADIARTPVNLKAGDRVTLYQDGTGVVRYYTIVRDPASTSIQAEDVVRLDREVKAVRADVTQLAAVRASVDEVKAASEARNLEITTDVATVKRDLAAVEQMKVELEGLRQSAVERERQVKALQAELTLVRRNFEQLTPRSGPARSRAPARGTAAAAEPPAARAPGERKPRGTRRPPSG